MSIGRFSNSIVSGTNENTLALVNLNVDFSLLKLDAPREFAGLGTSLTRQRRELAEDGPVHRTARRLGALFETIVPSSPTLIRAYGSRVSEISQEIAKTDASQRHGVFAECAGVDGTSVWAAATSGKSALSLHLLACMLARAWSGPEATSIWVEIVEQRRKMLKEQVSDGLFDSSVQLGLALSQDISRTDLAHWDASTRAWLEVADESQIRRQKQLMLIINNINIPVNQGNAQITTFSRVIEAWKTSVEALEKLFNGQSQRISNGAVLLGLASWHLYPRLLVLGDKVSEVEFKDEIIKNSGQLTVGLQSPDPNKDEGVYWSLSLAHLRFYGDPVEVTSFTTRDASRLSMTEFHLLVLGSILSNWGSYIRPDNFEDVAKFFIALSKSVSKEYRIHCEYDAFPFKETAAEVLRNWNSNWIKLIGDTCADFLSLKESEKTIATSIIALGHRRGKDMLSYGSLQCPPPYLGLNHPWIQHTLNERLVADRRRSVEMMRYIARRLGLDHDQCLIKNEESGEYLTAIPHKAVTGPDSSNQLYHISWHKLTESEALYCGCDFQGQSCCATRCPCVRQNSICTYKCHPKYEHRHQCEDQAPLRETLNDQNGSHLNSPGIRTLHYYGRFSEPWESAIDIIGPVPTHQNLLASKIASQHHPRNRNPLSRRLCSCYFEGQAKPRFTRITGIGQTVALYVRNNTQNDIRVVQNSIRKIVARERPTPIKEIVEMLETGAISSAPLVKFLGNMYESGRIDIPRLGYDIRITTFDVMNYLSSLTAVSLATKVYDDLPGSTISVQLISVPLYEAKWLPQFPTRILTQTLTLTRQQKFSCIAMLESGSYNVDPTELNDVIAISSRNSIFVSKLLLEDPYSMEQTESITRVVGNVGKTGMVFMVVPPTPRLRKIELDEYRLITHASFDGKLENSFETTSLHLRFTDFEMPFNIGQRGAIDKDLRIIETLVQVFDRNRWVADLDILPLFNPSNKIIRRNKIECTGCSSAGSIPRSLRSLDNWEELLETGQTLGTLEVGVLRAHKNWLARLAAACVSLQKGYRTVINPPHEVCWRCSCRNDWLWEPEVATNEETESNSEQDTDLDIYFDSNENLEDEEATKQDEDYETNPEYFLEAAHPIVLGRVRVSEGDINTRRTSNTGVVESINDFHENIRFEGDDSIHEKIHFVDEGDLGYASDETTILSGNCDKAGSPKRLPQIFII